MVIQTVGIGAMKWAVKEFNHPWQQVRRVSGLSLHAMMAPALTLHSSATETMIAEIEVMSPTVFNHP
jgi:hypothetical protein